MKLPVWTVDDTNSVSVTKGCALHSKECWYGTGNYVPRDPLHMWVRGSSPSSLPKMPDPPKLFIDLNGQGPPWCMPMPGGRRSGMTDNSLLENWLKVCNNLLRK